MEYYITPEVYRPSEDTYLLIDALDMYLGANPRPNIFLELCSGTGLVSVYIAANYEARVFSVDLDPKAALCTHRTAGHNGVDVNTMVGNGLSQIGSIPKNGLIFFNPPYLPDAGEEDPTIDGGAGGHELTKWLIKSALRFDTDQDIIFVSSSAVFDEVYTDFFTRIGVEHDMLLERRVGDYFEYLRAWLVRIRNNC